MPIVQGAGTPGVEIPIKLGDQGPLDSEKPKTFEVPVATAETPVATPVLAPEAKPASGTLLDEALQQVDAAGTPAQVVDAVAPPSAAAGFSVEGQRDAKTTMVNDALSGKPNAISALENGVGDPQKAEEPPEAEVIPEGQEEIPDTPVIAPPVITTAPAAISYEEPPAEITGPVAAPAPTLPQPPSAVLPPVQPPPAPAPAYPLNEPAVAMPTSTYPEIKPNEGRFVDAEGLTPSERGGDYIASSVEDIKRMTLDQLNEAITSGEKQLLSSNAELRRTLENSEPELGLNLLNLEATIRTIKSYLGILEYVRENKKNVEILAKSQQSNQTEQGPTAAGGGS